MDLNSLQGLDEPGEQVGHSTPDLRAVVSQSSLVQERHLREDGSTSEHGAADWERSPGGRTHQNIGNVLRLHHEELVVSDDRFEELQRHGGVLVAADAAGHQLETDRRTRLSYSSRTSCSVPHG